VSGYGDFCPVARASEIFAERWTPLIVREIVNGRHHFSEIHEALHRISPSVLGERLRELEDKGVVERRANPSGRGSTYHLTATGRELKPIIDALGAWGQQWLELREEHLDADALMYQLRAHVPEEALPAQQVIIRFDFRGAPRSYWLRLERPHSELCDYAPGPEDLVVRADLETLTRVYLGEVALAAALRTGRVTVEGPTRVARMLAKWIVPSRFAAYARPMRYDSTVAAFRAVVPAMSGARPRLLNAKRSARSSIGSR